MPDFNTQKQIDHWLNSDISDLDTSRILFRNGKILHGSFWCHLTIEKLLKAHFIKVNHTFAPKIHNLIYLANKAHLDSSTEQSEFMGILMRYQLEGRYPDYNPELPEINQAIEYLNKTEELFLWLRQKLSN